MELEVKIKKQIGDFRLDIDFKCNDDVIALWGPSGVGKSLALRCIAGVDTPDEGRIVIGNRVVYDSDEKVNIRPQNRNIGLLFQDYALFTNMTVRKNIEIVNKQAGSDSEFYKKFRIDGLENLYPHQLSGGQKQRVAMARMVCTNPDLLMFDEPFNALDETLKSELKNEIKTILKESSKTAIIVSHDIQDVNYFTGESSIIRIG